MTNAYYVDKKPLQVGKRIGRGGEGDVFKLEDGSGLALKIYKSPDQEREAKIAAMVAANLASKSSLIAFPAAVARNAAGRFAGFTMRLVEGHQPLHELYAPGSRKASFPKADYRFVVRSAANIARAVAQVHQAGAVIGDINHSGVLVSDKAIAALIDADSFQFGGHLCRVGVPEYTPPELQSKSLAGVLRTQQHDAFGLAVAIFQLLFMGRHPFVGRYARGEMPIEKAISEWRFAYSRRPEVGMTPPPGTCTLADFPKEIGEAFESAFGRDVSARPAAVRWVSLLQNLEPALRRCPANELHHFPATAASCTWCRLENTVGMILFVPVMTFGAVTPIVDPGAGGFDLDRVWATIERIQVPDPQSLQPPFPPRQLKPSEAAVSHKQAQWGRQILGYVAILSAVGLLFGMPALWVVYVPLAWFGVVQAFSTKSAQGPFPANFSKAENGLQDALNHWRGRIGAVEIFDRREALRTAKERYRALPGSEKKRLDEYESKRRGAQLQRFLDSHQIRRARIRGIGPGRIASLASYGIDTAADVNARAVLAVPGFGSVSARPLLDWRARMESRFVFSSQPTQADLQATEQIRRSFAAEAAQLRQELLRGANELNAGIAAVTSRRNSLDPVITQAYLGREQARIDLEFLGLPIPAVIATPSRVSNALPVANSPAPSRAVRASSSTTTGVSCPRCGGRMVKRTARRGINAGGMFWGCAGYPRCRGTRNI